MYIRQGRAAAAVAIISVFAALSAGGCGGSAGPSEEQTVRDTLVELQESFDEGDLETVCDAMTFRAWQQVGTAGHGVPSRCVRDLGKAKKYIDDGRVDGYRRIPTVTAIDVDGRRAVATAAFGGGATSRVELVRRANGWALDNFYGNSSGGGNLTAPPAGPPRVKTAAFESPAGRRCSAVTQVGPVLNGVRSELRGGCVVKAKETADIVFNVRTPFGLFEFGRCEVSFTLRVDGRGGVWLEDLLGAGAIACNDVDHCRKNLVHRPWVGYIDGPHQLRMNACFQTCIGEYRGEIVLDLREKARSWNLRAEKLTVGDASGWQVDGNWKVATNDLVLKHARPPASG